MRYLTTQDLIWIHSELTKSPQGFAVMDLEECVGYQYAYMQPPEVTRDVARFAEGILRRKPFEAENETTALIAALGSLALNGYDLSPAREEVHRMWAQVAAGSRSAADFVRSVIRGEPAGVSEEATETVLREILSRYA